VGRVWSWWSRSQWWHLLSSPSLVVVSIAIVSVFIWDGGQRVVMVVVTVAIVMVIGGGTGGVVMFMGTKVVVVAEIAEVVVTTIITVFVQDGGRGSLPLPCTVRWW